MAPIPVSRTPSGGLLQLRRISNSISTLRPRDITPSASVLEHLNEQPNLVPKAIDTLQQLSKPLKKAATLLKRQQILAIPTTYQGLNSGPAPGTVVGITLGAVGGFLLVLWLIFTCFNLGGGGRVVEEEEVVEVRHRSRSPRRSRSRSEVIEVTRSRTPPRRRETIVVEETRRTSAPVEREDDIVEVIEEHSPPRRVKSKRTSGFRTVDPAEFGGGDRPMRKVSRR